LGAVAWLATGYRFLPRAAPRLVISEGTHPKRVPQMQMGMLVDSFFGHQLVLLLCWHLSSILKVSIAR
jgi:hypothetical protein